MKKVMLSIGMVWLMVLLGSCNELPAISVQELCPSGPGISWVTIKPESVEFFQEEVSIDDLHDFRFLAVATDGRAPNRYLGCASALAFPQEANLAVNQTFEPNVKYYDFNNQSLVVDTDVLGVSPMFVYFVGLNAAKSSQEINDAIPAAVYAIRTAINRAVANPQTGDLGQDITTILLSQYPEYLTEEEVVGYGAFSVKPEEWLFGARHLAFANNRTFAWRYQLYQFDGLLLPYERNPQPVENIIRNGDFEMWWRDGDPIAPHWQGFTEDGGQIGWGKETWLEAVFEGKQSQMMQIGAGIPGDTDVTVAINQTVEIVPNSDYDLMLRAIMRSDADHADWDKGDYEMAWGVDYSGTGNYSNVLDWFPMRLSEQPRTGSNYYHDHGIGPPNRHLAYETVRGRVVTGGSNFISLFIRGLKKNATGAAINFNVDDVSLVGPSAYYAKFPPPPTPVPPADGAANPSDPSVSGPTPTPFAFPTTVPTIPKDATQFLVYVRDNYDKIDGETMRLEGIYLKQGDTIDNRRLIINLSSNSLYTSQSATARQTYLQNLLNDTMSFFNNQPSTVEVTAGNVTIDQTKTGCVLIRGVRSCPDAQKDITFVINGQTVDVLSSLSVVPSTESSK